MLIIRLQRVGRVNDPVFRVVLTDSKNGPKSGKFLEILGAYDPREKGGNKSNNKLNLDRIKFWMSNGAQVSDTMHNMLVDAKVIVGRKKNVLSKKSPIKKEEPKKDASSATVPSATPTTAPAEAPKA